MSDARTQPSSEPVGESHAETYSFLGPAGTFTEAALAQVPQAQGKPWRAVNNVGEALDDVVSGRSVAAMIAIENSIEGGVSATQDALATMPGLRIIGEYLVPVGFVLVARPGVALADVKTVTAHPVAYAQCKAWLGEHLPAHDYIPASSNVTAATSLLEMDDAGRPTSPADAAIAPPTIVAHHGVVVLAQDIIDNPNAVTRFALVSRTTGIPDPTGADKTSLIVELPSDRSGTLVEMLEQFSTRGVNLSLIESRPIGDEFGRYRFVIDADGHVTDERVADALLGLFRFSPNIIFLGSYPRADHQTIAYDRRYADDVFIEARDWLRGLIGGEPTA
ncbi:prephenate dehydratase [Planctomonas sp. JC2975]|uniref:prephenate dehydratase n=1 Tax=Planctomonas sp. JC2975 TaxID=2729626 RepID=UPI0014733BA6|nr:prephenate dehydratase [Planctomonas sp. JC2975]NNC12815.1 prephenate dehydratase [Planctomonas sp. JC2975]